MSSRFVGRWADRTASRRVCQPFRVFFCFVPLGGILVFIISRIDTSFIDAIFSRIPDSVAYTLRFIEVFALPRSSSELDAINESLGALYFRMTFLSEAILMISGISAILITLRFSVLFDVDDDFSIVQFLIRVCIVVAFLVVRPVSFVSPTVVANYVDKSGLFLIKESAVIAVGYYNLALILTDAFGRIVRRFRQSPLDRQASVQPLHDTESR